MNNTVDLKNLDSYTPEELQSFKEQIHKVYVKKTKPLAYKSFEVMQEYLTEHGFKHIEGKDERYFTNGRHGVFNCPHTCGSFEVWKDNPTIDRDKVIIGNIIAIRPNNFFGKDIEQEQYDIFLEKAKNNIDFYSQN